MTRRPFKAGKCRDTPCPVRKNQYKPGQLASSLLLQSVSFFIAMWIWGPGITHLGNLEVPAAQKSTGLKQATVEACRVWKHALGMSLSSLRCLFVKFCSLLLVSPLPVVLTLLISCKRAWWMSAVHPQHLVLRRIDVEVASRMETDEKRGLSLRPVQRLDHPGFACLRFLTLLFFLASTQWCCWVFPGPDSWHTLHSRSLVTVTETQRAQHTALCPVPDCLTSPLWKASPPCNVC